MFDALYNKGFPYWTVFGIRFSDAGLAHHYAAAKAADTGNPVVVYQYDDDNRSGFRLNVRYPENT